MKEAKIEEVRNGVLKIEAPLISPFYSLKRIRNYPGNYSGEYINTVHEDCIEFYRLIDLATRMYLSKHDFNVLNYQHCALVYVNYYRNSDCNIPDSDNYLYKPLTDLIVTHFCRFGDAFDELDIHFITLKGDVEKTEIYLLADWKRDEILKILLPDGE